ncbi:MAG: efflux RND transporter periplasmic adaptor subunit [Patescibacteria group bacterium]|nr:efflux RND transporter periplasmic adaptor subunit [Patescibacteria group bacterium]MDD5295006.1 efflux RND transporter periplasmic adaptor subunit [Patescibacteria group bacterium]MDD5554350.1 efflux RND transporter periplasmic adaptor subunit [Patescibacteria group bacterium]
MFLKIIKLVINHKVIAAIILLAVIVSGYFSYKEITKQEEVVSYTTSAVEKGMLISSVSGTGQVSALNQVDLKPKVSGDIVSVNVIKGQKVKEGDLIAQIDSRDAAQAVNEARANLENAKLDLQDLLAPPDALTLMQAENSLTSTRDSLAKLKITQENNRQTTLKNKQDAQDNLASAYEDAYNNIASTFLGLPNVMSGIYAVLYSNEVADSEITISPASNYSVFINSFLGRDEDERLKMQSYVEKAQSYYNEAKSDYDNSLEDYKSASRYSGASVIESLLSATIETAKEVADTVKAEKNILDYLENYQTDKGFSAYSKVSTYQTNLGSYTSSVNNYLSSLNSSEQSIKNYEGDISQAEKDLQDMGVNNPLDLAASERSVKEKEESLANLKAGATELEIKNKQLAVQQKQNSLTQAQQNYADCFIRAPFAGVVAEVSVAKGDSASSGSAVVTLITNQKIAEITLNEVDAAQVKPGQKATLEFDAVFDLSITGEVAEIDAIGTVSQGVVSYNVKVAFDVQDERVKPGMSTSVNIIVDSKQDVLLVPIGAVKTRGETNYVQVLVNGQPQSKTVTIGSSNDTMTEIISGLEEGEEVVTQTVSGSSSNNSSSTDKNSGGPGGGMMMMMR